jgi:hypothetical protein
MRRCAFVPVGVAIRTEPEVDDVELVELAHDELIGVGAVVAPHRVDGIGGTHLFEQGFSPEPFVGVGVIGRHAPLVAPVDVDLPPIDRLGSIVGQSLVAGARRFASGQRDRERVAGAPREGVHHCLAKRAGNVVDDSYLALHPAHSKAPPAPASQLEAIRTEIRSLLPQGPSTTSASTTSSSTLALGGAW